MFVAGVVVCCLLCGMCVVCRSLFVVRCALLVVRWRPFCAWLLFDRRSASLCIVCGLLLLLFVIVVRRCWLCVVCCSVFFFFFKRGGVLGVVMCFVVC